MKRPIEERFWEKVEKTNYCWNWTGCIMKGGGYGLFMDDKLKLAHRVVWELERGIIPKGLCVLHKCDNRRCVNPDHLFLGTHQDNTDDMISKGRWKYPVGEQLPQTKLSEEQARNALALYRTGAYFYREIAQMFGVSYGTIGDIVRGTTWKHIHKSVPIP